jgi:hypothetical protein
MADLLFVLLPAGTPRADQNCHIAMADLLFVLLPLCSVPSINYCVNFY